MILKYGNREVSCISTVPEGSTIILYDNRLYGYGVWFYGVV